jgi:polar amino acid transport system permease protein
VQGLLNDLGQWLPILLRGMLETIEVAAATLGLAVVWGVVLAMAKLSKLPGLRHVAIAYIELFRVVPVLTTLFIIYFGLAAMGLKLASFPAAVVGLASVGGAYMAENVRSGILAVEHGQREAALSVGLRPGQAMALVIMPQAIRVAVPPSINYSIGLLKDTAIVSTVAVPDLLFRSQGLVSLTIRPLPIYALAGVLYLFMSVPLARLGKTLERRFAVRSNG